jgi:hypothetical protein
MSVIPDEKLQPGKCRYAMPWNPCNNQMGNKHHGECIDREKLARRLVEVYLVDNEWYLANFAHDELGLSWVDIWNTMEFDI